MNKLIESSISFGKKLEIDAETDFNHHHRRGVTSKLLGAKSQTQVDFILQSLYGKEFKAIIDALMISLLRDNLQFV